MASHYTDPFIESVVTSRNEAVALQQHLKDALALIRLLADEPLENSTKLTYILGEVRRLEEALASCKTRPLDFQEGVLKDGKKDAPANP